MALGWRRKRQLVDKKPPKAPYFLAGNDLFIKQDGREIFVKHIFCNLSGCGKFVLCCLNRGLREQQ